MLQSQVWLSVYLVGLKINSDHTRYVITTLLSITQLVQEVEIGLSVISRVNKFVSMTFALSNYSWLSSFEVRQSSGLSLF